MVQSPVFEHRNGINIDFHPERHGFLVFLHAGKIGRVQNILRRITRQNPQSDLPDGNTVERRAKGTQQTQNREVAQGLTSIVDAKIRVCISSRDAPVLALNNVGIVDIEWGSELVAQFERVNAAGELVFVVDELHGAKVKSRGANWRVDNRPILCAYLFIPILYTMPVSTSTRK